MTINREHLIQQAISACGGVNVFAELPAFTPTVSWEAAVQRNPQGPHEQGLPDGRVIQVTERATPDAGLVITYHDVTELRRASAEIENLAFYDPLTGLPNRRLLMDRIQQSVVANARSGLHGALLFLDLDHFKTLNDTLGHDMGDLLLQQVAQRLGRQGAGMFQILRGQAVAQAAVQRPAEIPQPLERRRFEDDGVAAAVTLAEGLVRLGLGTSRLGGYAPAVRIARPLRVAGSA